MDYGYYDYGYGYDVGSTVATGFGAVLGFVIFIWIIAIAVLVFNLICTWKVYKKAGKQGWEAIVPVYNFVVLLQITGQPMWYIALLFVPVANIVALVLIYLELAKKFGKDTGFGIGLAFLTPIFMAILAFDKKCQFVGVASANVPTYNSQTVYAQPEQPIQPQQPVESEQPEQPVQPVESEQPEQPVQPVQSVEPQPTVSTNCSRCGAPINAGDKFCMSCGNQL